MTGPRHPPTHQGERNDIENPAGESPADWHLPPGADRLHVRADIGGGGIASPADPSGVGAGLVPAPIRAGGKLGHADYLRERRARERKPAWYCVLARFYAGRLHFHGAE